MRLVNNENKARRIVIIKLLIILKFHLKRNMFGNFGGEGFGKKEEREEEEG